MNMKRLGIFDWGIGGFGFYKELKKIQPKSSVTYFSDAGFTPYGKVNEDTLRQRCNAIINWLKDSGCDQVFVACNAASTVLMNSSNIEVTNIINAGLNTVENIDGNKVAIIGGKRTVESHIYRDLLKGFEVTELVAQPISALIEKGDIQSSKLEVEISKVCTQIKESHILLACTHYPAAIKLFNKVCPDKIFLDPVPEAIKSINNFKILESQQATDMFYTTGDADKMSIAALQSFQVNLSKIKKVNI